MQPERLTPQQSAQLNLLAETSRRATPLALTRPRDRRGLFQHPWKTTVERTREAWKVNVRPGTVNDELALYSYLKSGDARSWQMPEDYVPAADLSIYGKDYPLVDRSPFEKIDPPYLLVKPPNETATELGDFAKPAFRPKYFTGYSAPPISGLGRIGGATNSSGDDITTWPLFLAYVMVSATPFRASKDFTAWRPDLTLKLKRYRLFAGRKPTTTDNIGAGEAFELARLWLLRNPAAPVTSDSLYVQQTRFWCFQSVPVQPSFELGEFKDDFAELAALIGFGGLAQDLATVFVDPIQANLESAATIEIWTA